MATITVRHSRADSLANLKALVQRASREARQGREWQEIAALGNVYGVLCGPEVTWSPKHGWHFHVHLAIVCGTCDDGAAQTVGRRFVDRYLTRLRHHGGSAQSAGQDVQIARVAEKAAEYIAKQVSWETSGGGGKTRAVGWTPWEIAQAAVDGSKTMRALYREYAAAMIGTRSCVVNASLADKLGIDLSTENQSAGGDQTFYEAGTLIGTVDGDSWNTLMKRRKVPTLIAMVEEDRKWSVVQAWVKEAVKPITFVEPILPPRAPVRQDFALWRHRGSTAARLSAEVQRQREAVALRPHYAHPIDLTWGALTPIVAELAIDGQRPLTLSLT